MFCAATATASELAGRLEQVKQALDSHARIAHGREAEGAVAHLPAPRDGASAERRLVPVIAVGEYTAVHRGAGWQRGCGYADHRGQADRDAGQQFKIAREELDREAASLRKTVEKDLKELEDVLDKIGAPWMPGRLPVVKDK